MNSRAKRLEPTLAVTALLTTVVVLLWPALFTGRLPAGSDLAFHAQFATVTLLVRGRWKPREA